jgi:uncharacterized protein YkwD
MPLILVAALLAALAAVPASAAAAAPAHDPAERRLAALIAADRAAHDLPPLRLNRRLARAADRHAARLARANRLWHRSGRSLSRTAGSAWTGEVLARAASPTRALAAWLRSPPHRAVLRAPRARALGVAISGNVFVGQLAGE